MEEGKTKYSKCIKSIEQPSVTEKSKVIAEKMGIEAHQIENRGMYWVCSCGYESKSQMNFTLREEVEAHMSIDFFTPKGQAMLAGALSEGDNGEVYCNFLDFLSKEYKHRDPMELFIEIIAETKLAGLFYEFIETEKEENKDYCIKCNNHGVLLDKDMKPTIKCPECKRAENKDNDTLPYPPTAPIFTDKEKYYIENIVSWGSVKKPHITEGIIELNYVKVVCDGNYLREYYNKKGHLVDQIYGHLID